VWMCRVVCLVWSVGWLYSIWWRAECRICRIWGTPIFEWCLWLVRARNGVYLWLRGFVGMEWDVKLGLFSTRLFGRSLVMELWFDLVLRINDVAQLIRLSCAPVQKVFPSLTKIVGTLGPKSHSVEVIQECLTAGMSGLSSTSLLVSSFIWNEINSDIVGY
jgi:hypothetical protein